MTTKIIKRILPFASNEEAIAYAKMHVLEKVMKDPTKFYTTTIELSNGKLFTAYAGAHYEPIFTA